MLRPFGGSHYYIFCDSSESESTEFAAQIGQVFTSASWSGGQSSGLHPFITPGLTVYLDSSAPVPEYIEVVEQMFIKMNIPSTYIKKDIAQLPASFSRPNNTKVIIIVGRRP